jgi:thioredoxin reductase
MADVIIIGDGPGGLSAALFLAKNGKDVVVLGEDKTAMHYAYLFNYLGIPEISGTEFQRRAREHATHHGASIEDERVQSLERTPGGFAVTLASGARLEAKYVILSEGKGPRLSQSIGLIPNLAGGIDVDRSGRSSVDNAYVVGRSARPSRSQAIISAGDGAAAALDILSREAGKDVADWDEPPKAQG